MEFRTSLIIGFATIIALSVGLTAYFALEITTEAVIDSELQEMQRLLFEKENVIGALHEKATDSIVFGVTDDEFTEYFELEETRAGNVYDENDIMQFTPKQQELKTELEEIIWNFQNQFVVDETCLIDHTGQEHARLVHSVIAPVDELSSEETAAPFFKSSFALEDGESYIQYPYVSPDSHRWVFSYTTPIVLDNGDKPAIYHFEMPIEIFQNMVDVDIGRMYVLDRNGYVIADSQGSVPTQVQSVFHAEHFPSIQQAFAEETFYQSFEEMKSNKMGMGMYDVGNQEHFFVYDTLDTFEWIIVYEKPESIMLSGTVTNLLDLQNTIFVIALTAILGGVGAAIIISSRLTKPLHQLSESVRTENPERLELLESTSSNEVNDVTTALNRLIMQVNEYQERTHMQKRELEIQSAQLDRLAKIGELSSRLTHNLRNPLTVIRTTLDLMHLSAEKLNDPKINERLDRLDRASSNIGKQIEEVLTYVQNKPLDIKSISLPKLIENAMYNLEIPDTIAIQLPKNQIMLNCDAEKLQVVFMNLFTNSIQAMENKGKISLFAEEGSGEVIIRIQDEGPRIPPDALEKVFDTLFTTKSSGTGLGLPYCKSVIEQHGGSISVTTNPTTFTIVLPTKSIQKENLE